MIIRNPYAKKNKARPAISDRPLFAPFASDTIHRNTAQQNTSTGNDASGSDVKMEIDGNGGQKISTADNLDSKPAANIKNLQSPPPSSSLFTKPISIELPNWKRLPSSQIVSAELITVSELMKHAKLFCGRSVRLLCAKYHGLTTSLSAKTSTFAESNDDSFPTTWVHVGDPLASFAVRDRHTIPTGTPRRSIPGERVGYQRITSGSSGQGKRRVIRISRGGANDKQTMRKQAVVRPKGTPLHSKLTNSQAVMSNPYVSGRSNSINKPVPTIAGGLKPPPRQISTQARFTVDAKKTGIASKRPPPTPRSPLPSTAPGVSSQKQSEKSHRQGRAASIGAKRELPKYSNPYLRQPKRSTTESATPLGNGSASTRGNPLKSSVSNGSLPKRIKVKTIPRHSRLLEASARLANTQRLVTQNANTALKRRISLPAPRPLPQPVSTVAATSHKKTMAHKVKKSCFDRTKRRASKPLRVTFVSATKSPNQIMSECVVKLDHAVSWVNTSMGAFTSANSNLVTIIGTVKSDGDSFYLEARVVRHIPSTNNPALDHRILLQRRHFLYNTIPKSSGARMQLSDNQRGTPGGDNLNLGFLPGCGPPPYPPQEIA